jgi:3-hydroxyisobutyrate dehydrogenase-like beta-hydroxyacid dehydrogenase
VIRKVGFIGLAPWGKPMAINIVNAGFYLMVYDIGEEPLRELSEDRKLQQLADQALQHIPLFSHR